MVYTSVTQSCLAFCDPMNHSTPGLPVHHQLLEFTQTHVHRVSDAIQPSHPLSSPSLPAPNPSQHQGLLLFIRAPEFTHPSKLKLRSLWPTCPHFPHSILWVQLFYILHIIEIIQCLSFCAWFISLNIMFPRFIHVVTNGKISFLSMVE